MPETRMSYPLSLAQQLCYQTISWAGYYPKTHHVEWTAILHGPIKRELMCQCISTVLSQNSILRSRIVNATSREVRIIPPWARRGRSAGEQVYLSRAGDRERSEDSDAISTVKAFVNKPFKLDSDDPMRVLLLETTNRTAWVLCAVGHHLAIDHKGMTIVIDSILQEYARSLRGSGNRLSVPVVPTYFDFIELEEASLKNGHMLKRAREARHPSATPLLSVMPRDRDDIQLNATIRQGLTIDGEHYERLSRVAEDYSVTQFTLLLQVVFSALRGVFGQTELTIQVVQDTRRRPFLHTVGHFGDILLIEQTEIPEHLHADKLRSLQDQLFRAIADRIPLMICTEQVPWVRERMNRALNPCEVMINYISETAPPTEVQSEPQLRLEPFVVNLEDNAADPFDGILLYLRMVRFASSVEVTIYSQSEILPADIAENILQQLLVVLSSL